MLGHLISRGVELAEHGNAAPGPEDLLRTYVGGQITQLST